MAADDINEAGGIKVGSDTYMIKIISCDTKYVSSAAADCAAMMIYDEKIKFVIGPIGTVRAVRDTFEAAEVMQVYLSTTYVNPDLYYIFNGNTDNTAWVETWVKQAYEEHPEIKTLAIINPDVEGGQDWARDHHVAAAKYGQTIVAEEWFTYGTTDFYPILTKILSKNPDAIALDGTPAGSQVLMTKQARELGFTGWIQHPAPVPLALLKASMPDEYLYNIATNEEIFSEAMFTQSVRDLNERVVRDHIKAGETMNCCTIHGYSHVVGIVTAIEDAQSVDPFYVVKAMEDPDFRFNRIYVENASVGGFETYGVRRQWPHFQAYSEIQNGVITAIKAQVVITP
jgi:branched-chain amino acid transport system substrate-binding protein